MHHRPGGDCVPPPRLATPAGGPQVTRPPLVRPSPAPQVTGLPATPHSSPNKPSTPCTTHHTSYSPAPPHYLSSLKAAGSLSTRITSHGHHRTLNTAKYEPRSCTLVSAREAPSSSAPLTSPRRATPQLSVLSLLLQPEATKTLQVQRVFA